MQGGFKELKAVWGLKILEDNKNNVYPPLETSETWLYYEISV